MAKTRNLSHRYSVAVANTKKKFVETLRLLRITTDALLCDDVGLSNSYGVDSTNLTGERLPVGADSNESE